MLVTLRKALGRQNQKVIHNQQIPTNFLNPVPRSPKVQVPTFKKEVWATFYRSERDGGSGPTQEGGPKRQEVAICGKREGQAAREEKLGRLPHVLSTPRSGWEALQLSQKTPLKPSGAQSGALSFFMRPVPPSQRGTRRPAIARGAHSLPYPRAHPLSAVPAGHSILTWGSRPTAALAMRTTRIAALTSAPPRPGAGPQLSPVDLSLRSGELERPHPPERVPAVRPATLSSPEAALPSVLRGHTY